VKKVAGTTTHYVYGLNGLLYGECDNAGALIREYVYLNDVPLAQIDAGAPEVLTYLHPDHLGTPRFGTNTGGTQVWAWAGDAFGVGTPTGSATVNIRMPGQYVDAESGLFYNWNRYYNPNIGRYISSDPIGIDGGLNTFLYAEANPVMYMDPEGLYSLWDFQGDIADATISGLQGLAGLTDALTLGQSKAYRERTGQDYVDPCDGVYAVGAGLGAVAQSTALGGSVYKGGNWILGKIARIDPNKLNHIFGQAKHKLEPLLAKFGGNQEKAFRALENAAQKALKSGKLNLKNGINSQTRINVNGIDVDLVGGRVVNGRFNIGSASRRDIP